MRATLTIDDALMRDLRRAAESSGLSLEELVNRALRAGLGSLERPPRRRRYGARVFAMGNPIVDLDKALRLAGDLEDEEIRASATGGGS